jgi:uncharacterized protein with HEPN domain
MTKDSRVYLAHILERIDRINLFTDRGRDAFFADAMIQDAVVRNLEVIGEAAKRVPDDYRQVHPTIPWRSLAALRDVLIHQYEGVSLPEVWEVVEKHLPPIREALVTLLPPLDQLEREIAGDEDSGPG